MPYTLDLNRDAEDDIVAAPRLIVWAVGTHSEEVDDVYRALAAVLGAKGITVGSWDATELPEQCCAPGSDDR